MTIQQGRFRLTGFARRGRFVGKATGRGLAREETVLDMGNLRLPMARAAES